MRIKIDVTRAGDIDAAIEQIKLYKQHFERDCNRLCERLAELGSTAARVRYEVAGYAGENDVEVHTEPTSEGCYIVASGTTVGFIEFGTGIAHPLGEFAAQAGAPEHGTYGKGLGTKPSWTYIGNPGNTGQVIANAKNGTVIRTTGNDPANAFPSAVKAIQDNFMQVAREVFGS